MGSFSASVSFYCTLFIYFSFLFFSPVGAVFAQMKIIIGVDSIEGKAFETSSKVIILLQAPSMWK